MAGRPPTINNEKRSAICSLVAVGASLRQASHFTGCSLSTVLRDVKRNDDFRKNLEKARSEAHMKPIETLRHAAATNWRAALAFIERLEPDRFSNPTEAFVTKREANRFIDDLLWAIDENVKKPRQRENLLETLSAAMPPAMRRRWESDAMGRAMEQVQEEIKIRKRDRRIIAQNEIVDHYNNCVDLNEEIKQYLPAELRQRVEENLELLLPKQLPAELAEEIDEEDKFEVEELDDEDDNDEDENVEDEAPEHEDDAENEAPERV